MQLKNLLTDDDAVSPVIGVILMVAITVILAAVIAAFVLGLGESDELGPQVSFDWDFEDDANSPVEGSLTITHQSGDSFTASEVSIEGDAGTDPADDTVIGDSWNEFDGDVDPSDSVSAGNRITIADALDSDFDIDLVWTSQDGDDSNIIGSRSGPDA